MEASIWQAVASLTTPTTNSLNRFSNALGQGGTVTRRLMIDDQRSNTEQSIIFIPMIEDVRQFSMLDFSLIGSPDSWNPGDRYRNSRLAKGIRGHIYKLKIILLILSSLFALEMVRYCNHAHR